MVKVVISPYNSKVFPWKATASAQRYSSVFETKEGAKAAMEARFGFCCFIERSK